MSFFYRKGTLGIIIISVHDGRQMTNKHGLRQRKKTHDQSKQYFNNDENTRNISQKTYKLLITMLKEKPYLLINNIHRKFIDLNRPISVGTCDKSGRYYWNNFHNKLSAIIKECKQKYGYCLLFDIHCNLKTHNLIELGYGIKMKSIEKFKFKESSLDFLKHYYSLKSLIIGDRSLGNYLHQFIDTVPSPILFNYDSLNNLAIDKFYYNGGYITKNYSKNYQIDAIQIELSIDLCKLNKINYVSEILAKAIYHFYNINYHFYNINYHLNK